MNHIDETVHEQNITLEVEGESFRVSSVDITKENEGEEFYGADEYEVFYDSRGHPFFIPKGPRKLQGISVDRMAHGTIRVADEKPDFPSGEYGVPEAVDVTIKMDSKDVDLPNTIFTNEDFDDGGWVFDFVSDLED